MVEGNKIKHGDNGNKNKQDDFVIRKTKTVSIKKTL
jgi:hypothetical protein